MDLADVKHWRQIKTYCGCSTGEMLNTGMKTIDWLIAEVERLKEDREWQIKQNERMFTALDQIAKHLKLPCDQRDDGVLEQIVEAAMMID